MTPSAEEIRAWLKIRVGNLTGIPQENIDENEPLMRLGLDSVAVVTLASDLEIWAKFRFRENPLEQYPTIAALAEFVAGEVREKEGQAPPTH